MAQSKADAELRVQAMTFALSAGCYANADVLVKAATYIFAFLSGDDSAPSTTPRTSTRGKADAPDTGSENASSPSSDKPAASTAASTADEKPKEPEASTTTSTTKSPSDKGAGFTADGSEITKEDIIKKAMEYSATPSLGQAKFVALLDEYGSANISGLDTARYAEFIAALQSGIDEAKAMA